MCIYKGKGGFCTPELAHTFLVKLASAGFGKQRHLLISSKNTKKTSMPPNHVPKKSTDIFGLHRRQPSARASQATDLGVGEQCF